MWLVCTAVTPGLLCHSAHAVLAVLAVWMLQNGGTHTAKPSRALVASENDPCLLNLTCRFPLTCIHRHIASCALDPLPRAEPRTVPSCAQHSYALVQAALAAGRVTLSCPRWKRFCATTSWHPATAARQSSPAPWITGLQCSAGMTLGTCAAWRDPGPCLWR